MAFRKVNSMSTNEELCSSIEKFYGFKRELICNAQLCGLWHVRFTVNNINYYGHIPYHGAEPQLSVTGYEYKYFWHGSPVTEEYYKEFIEGKRINLQRCIDGEAGEWEFLDKTFNTPGEAEEYIATLDKPSMYSYDIK